MSFRVTTSLQVDRSLYDIQAANARLDAVQRDLSTGKKLHRPSDDPTANARAMVLKTSMADNTQYLKNIDSAKGFVNTTDSAMSGYLSSLQRLRNLAVQGANGTLDQNAKAAIGQEISQLRDEIRSIGNTQYNGRYIFGGIKVDQQPYPTDVTLSPNDTGNLSVDVAPGVSSNYNISGVAIFGDTSGGTTDNTNIFGVIDNFTALLQQTTSTADVSQQVIAGVDKFITAAGNQRTTLGGWQNRLDLGTENLTTVNTNLQNLLSSTEDTDIATASLQMNQGQATLTAALEVGAKAMPLTLVDFLR